jgi:hypothetical protein
MIAITIYPKRPAAINAENRGLAFDVATGLMIEDRAAGDS